ncbi:helix-turn-helix domain-containing protein [Paraflavisolibacter sp. H34]|uniref:helix-turn-helix domain-containing protein n=1 Tax=Huijunlia imazamoxiresistens TaxID=3127457 RepID=UPI00301A6CEC
MAVNYPKRRKSMPKKRLFNRISIQEQADWNKDSILFILGVKYVLSMPQQIPIYDKSETGRLIKVEPFKKSIRKTTPHKHNKYLEIIYLSQGSGIHSIDGENYPVQPPVVFVVRQDQVHCWELEAEAEGYVVILKKEFVEKVLDKELKSLLVHLSTRCCRSLKKADLIEIVFQLLAEESNTAGEQPSLLLEGLLKALLAKMLDMAEPLLPSSASREDLYNAFIQLLNADAGIQNKVAVYAERLHTSPQNLNAACRRAANQSAREVLSGYVLSEAKRLLLYTGNTVSEIAATLEFTDPSHFVKFFKRLTGTTPQLYRTGGA